MQKTAGPQLNQAREDFNKRVSRKSMLGKSKKVQWESCPALSMNSRKATPSKISINFVKN